MAIPICLSLSPHPPNIPSLSSSSSSSKDNDPHLIRFSKREFISKTAKFLIFSLAPASTFSQCSAEPSPPPKAAPLGIANTKSWFQFYGAGFAIRVPPQFEDITEPEDYNAGMSLYGDKAKPKKFAARFALPDGSEVVSVVIRPTNQLKITFLEAQDITDLGSLKEAAKIFVPGGATIYSARNIKIKEEEGFKTYYFYEFSRDQQHVALVAAVDSGKVFIAGATAPQSKWEDDGVRLRSAAISLTLL
ncbi:hypothetical protein ACJRO7_032905 [Eucalyptus globulus]|uniref:PsbP C-terminal domain-containing protein n=1 Tax=Eucalyptus globulus TaxID=34317 RepID=A0ABD3JL36_EUCGL